MTEIDKYSRGIVKDRNRLYWEDFKRMPSCYPPPHEQVKIADAIDKECNDINITVDRIRRKIELLREYRTRLIADVVTGKLDVREAAASLPTEYSEPDRSGDEDIPFEIDEMTEDEAVLEELTDE
jgi:type I restriction enzyme S subunit